MSEEKKRTEIKDRKKLIGKSFVINEERNEYMGSLDIAGNKAFIILDIKDDGRYAKCIVLHSSEIYMGINFTTLGLWTKARLRLMSNETEPYFIDMYDEISNMDFIKLYEEYKGDIDKQIN